MKQTTFVLLMLFLCMTELVAQITEETELREDFRTGVRIFKLNGKTGIKEGNKVILKANYESAEKISKHFFVVRKNNLYGCFAVKLRKMILPAAYEQIRQLGDFSGKRRNKHFFVVKKGGKYGMIDDQNQVLVEMAYDKITNEYNYLKLYKMGKVGAFFFDKSRENIPVTQDGIREAYYEGVMLLIVQKDGIHEYYDFNGKKILSGCCKSDAPFLSSWGKNYPRYRLLTNLEGKQGIYDFRGRKWLFPPNHTHIIDFFDRYLIVKKGRKLGVVDEQGQVVIPAKYDTVAFLRPAHTSEDKRFKVVKNISAHILVGKKGKLGLRSWENKAVTPLKYKEIAHIHGFYKVKKGKRYKIINRFGKVISSLAFDHVGYFYNGKCAVFQNQQMTYLLANGKLVQPFKRSKVRGYHRLENLYKTLAKVLKSESDSLLMQFCQDLVPDDYSKALMNRIGFDYQRFGLAQLDKNVKRDFSALANFRSRLKMKGFLSTLTFERLFIEGRGYKYLGKGRFPFFDVTASGRYTSGNKKIIMSLRALSDLDGYWKRMTTRRIILGF